MKNLILLVLFLFSVLGAASQGTFGDTMRGLSCSIDQIAKWNGTVWVCADDGGGGGGGEPGGDPSSIQFNDSGSFGGFGEWDGSTLTIPGDSVSDSLTLNDNAGSGSQIAAFDSLGGLARAASNSDLWLDGTNVVFGTQATVNPSTGVAYMPGGYITGSNTLLQETGFGSGTAGAIAFTGGSGISAPNIPVQSVALVGGAHPDSGVVIGNTGEQAVIEVKHGRSVWISSSFLALNANVWPAADGTIGQFIKTDGAGNLSFTSDIPAPGSTGDLFYNEAGAITPISYVTWNAATPMMVFSNSWASFPGNSRVEYDETTVSSVGIFNPSGGNAGGVPLESFTCANGEAVGFEGDAVACLPVSASIGGGDQQTQFNYDGLFGGAPELLYDKTASPYPTYTMGVESGPPLRIIWGNTVLQVSGVTEKFMYINSSSELEFVDNPAGNPFDQDLNTSDGVSFGSVKTYLNDDSDANSIYPNARQMYDTDGSTVLFSWNNGIGFFGATPVTQSAAIPDATGGVVSDDEARAALNALLAYLRLRGDIAP